MRFSEGLLVKLAFLIVRSLRITHELLGQLAIRHETFKDNELSVAQMGELVDLVQSKRITGE